MTSTEKARLVVVNDLLSISRPLHEITLQLASINWDYEGSGVELMRCHFVAALQRYLRDELSAEDIEFWANQIEGRDDVYFETGCEQRIEKVLYELANPMLTQPLTKVRAKVILEKLLVESTKG